MILRTLQLHNFRQHADTAVSFPEPGIIGIVGQNESGKSTILEGATWALYGSKALRGTKDSLRWNRAPARHVATAELTFEVGGQEYRVERSESNAKLYEGAVPVAEGTSAVDAYIPAVVGMSLREFEATYLCAQKDLGRLASMGPTDRQTFVRSVMGLDRIDAALEAIRKRKNELAREMEGTAAGLGERGPLTEEHADAEQLVTFLSDQRHNLANAVAAIADDHEAAAGRLLSMDQVKERHDQLQREAENAELVAERRGEEVARLKSELAKTEAAAKRLVVSEPKLARLPELRSQRDRLLKAQERASNRQQLAASAERLKAEVSAVSAEIEELDEAISAHDDEALQRVVDQYSALEDRATSLRRDREAERLEAKTLSDAAGARCDKIRQQIATLGDAGADGPCPTCTRPLGEHLGEVMATLEQAASEADAECREQARRAFERSDVTAEESAAERERLEVKRKGEELKEVRTRAREAQQRIGKLRSQLVEKREEHARQVSTLATVGPLEFSAEALEQVEAGITQLEDLERDQVAGDRATVARQSELRQGLQEARTARDQATARFTAATEAMDAIDYDPPAHTDLFKETDQLRQRLEEARRDATAVEERWKAAEERRARAEHQVQEYDRRAQKLDALREDLRIHTAAADRLNGFRIEQASLIRPELEELTSGFISILTDGRHDSVTVTEDFGVVLQESGLDTEVVSGGTEDIAAIALRLAMSQMIAERAGHPLSLLILDEPFGSLDEVRRGNVLTLIRRLSGTFEQVLVISHVAETRDAVDHVIELDYDEAAGRSRVIAGATVATPAEVAA